MSQPRAGEVLRLYGRGAGLHPFGNLRTGINCDIKYRMGRESEGRIEKFDLLGKIYDNLSTIRLKGKQPIIYCPARNIEGMCIKPELKKPLKKPLEEGRLLVFSPFAEKEKRISAERALERNRFVATIADKILVPYAEQNSKTEAFCRELIEKGKPVLTFNGVHNKNLIGVGACVIDAASVHPL